MTDNENFTAYGWNGDLIVTPDKVTLIHFKGKRQKDILVKHITAIEFQNAGLFAKGHIAFSFHGGQEYHTKALGKGVFLIMNLGTTCLIFDHLE